MLNVEANISHLLIVPCPQWLVERSKEATAYCITDFTTTSLVLKFENKRKNHAYTNVKIWACYDLLLSFLVVNCLMSPQCFHQANHNKSIGKFHSLSSLFYLCGLLSAFTKSIWNFTLISTLFSICNYGRNRFGCSPFGFEMKNFHFKDTIYFN